MSGAPWWARLIVLLVLLAVLPAAGAASAPPIRGAPSGASSLLSQRTPRPARAAC